MSANCTTCGQTCPPAKAERKPRAPSAYNVYFKEQMATPEVKAMEHKQRMKYISDKWKKQKEPAAAAAQAPADSDTLPAGRPALVRTL